MDENRGGGGPATLGHALRNAFRMDCIIDLFTDFFAPSSCVYCAKDECGYATYCSGRIRSCIHYCFMANLGGSRITAALGIRVKRNLRLLLSSRHSPPRSGSTLNGSMACERSIPRLHRRSRDELSLYLYQPMDYPEVVPGHAGLRDARGSAIAACKS